MRRSHHDSSAHKREINTLKHANTEQKALMFFGCLSGGSFFQAHHNTSHLRGATKNNRRESTDRRHQWQQDNLFGAVAEYTNFAGCAPSNAHHHRAHRIK